MEAFHNSIVLLLLILCINHIHSFSDITSQTMSGNYSGMIAAFGDFNSDKWTDVFVLDKKANRIKIFLGNGQNAPYLYESDIFINITGKTVVSLAASDLDGDSNMDVMLVLQTETGNKFQVEIHRGYGNNFFNETILLDEILSDQPLIADYNMDMIPEIFGETKDGDKMYFWKITMNGTSAVLSKQQVWKNTNDSLHHPSSMAFVDLHDHVSPGLFLRTNETTFGYYIIKNDQLELNTTFSLSYELKELLHVGEPAFVDFDGDGHLDVLVPACNDSSCTQSGIYLLEEKQSTLVFIADHGDLFTSSASQADAKDSDRACLRVADFDLDGYPDIVVPLFPREITTKDMAAVALLRNVPCSSSTRCWKGRRFELTERHPIPAAKSRIVPAFFDIGEDGIVELMVSYDSDDSMQMIVLNNDMTKGSCFLKVLVLSGSCNGNSCPNNVLPYGSNVPGPVIVMTTTSMSGDESHFKAAQLSQSAYFALQLPYTVFGLGKTPNFVDKLNIKVQNVSTPRQHQWTSLIPNSQLVVYPYPLDHPDSWVAKLFITPSRLVILTAIALGSTCVFIIILIGLLHWREKRQDEKEKRELANRFHFDAM